MTSPEPLPPASAQRFWIGFSRGFLMLARQTASTYVTSCRFVPVTTIDNGIPRSSAGTWRLLPFFSLSAGLGPADSCAIGALFIASSILCQRQAMPFTSAYSAKLFPTAAEKIRPRSNPENNDAYDWSCRIPLAVPSIEFLFSEHTDSLKYWLRRHRFPPRSATTPVHFALVTTRMGK